jgi:hypothetical protein
MRKKESVEDVVVGLPLDLVLVHPFLFPRTSFRPLFLHLSV